MQVPQFEFTANGWLAFLLYVIRHFGLGQTADCPDLPPLWPQLLLHVAYVYEKFLICIAPIFSPEF